MKDMQTEHELIRVNEKNLLNNMQTWLNCSKSMTSWLAHPLKHNVKTVAILPTTAFYPWEAILLLKQLFLVSFIDEFKKFAPQSTLPCTVLPYL